MKVKKLIQAMWLPGFEPEADPIQVLGAIECAPKTKEKATTWPRIDHGYFAGLDSPVEKFQANLEAIKLLRQLEGGKRLSLAEFRTLCRYTGWGGLPQAFNLASEGKWRERAEELRTLLADSEWESARDSTPNAHYTSIEVIEAMWAMARRMGFEGGSILEPSAGVGYFIGAMPEVLRKSAVTMVELDSLSARIARTLYEPYGVRVIQSGFEAAQFAESSFDLAIGNVPFGNYKVAEKRNVPFKDFTIHNYFVARALEVVRPGGIVMFVTSSFTLDAANDAVRRYLAQQAELIAAIRLPSTTFAKIANTRVTTDIIILKKRATPKVHVDEVWVESVWLPAESPLNTAGVPLRVNRWFVENPQWVIGKLALTDNGYAKSTGCVFDGDLAEELARRVEWLPEGVFNSNAATFVSVSTQVTDLPPGYHVIDGDVVEVIDGRAVKVQASGKTLERIRGLIEVRDAARKLVAAQAQLDDETKVGVFRVALNATYDAFVQKYGYINASANRRAFKNDPALPLLLSLERWDEETETAEKADIFFRRTVGVPHVVESADSPQEALLITLAESGGVMLPHRIAELLGKSEEEAMQALETIGAVFLDPESNQWVTADQYLSGNVRHKLAVAKTAGERFAHNVTALEAVLPKDLAPSEIDVRLGASWIPTDVYEDFINELLECTENKVEFNEQAGAFNVEPDYRTRWSVLATRAYGTSEVNAITLFEQALNQQVPTVKKKDYVQDKYVVDQQATIAAREKQQAIKDRFAQWVWADEFRAARLVRLYNERFNSVIPRKFDGSHLVLKGFSSVYTLRPHQKDAIWRIVASGKNTLLAHVVGAGKTLVMICAAMELRRVGKATKPMIVVPNHMLEQVSREFLMAYPSANVLMVSKNDLSGDKRRQFCARIATGDWDAVIITHSSFERIKMSDDFMRSYILDEIARIEEALEEYAHSSNRGNRIVKELARARKAWEARLTGLAREDKKDDLLSFEELGVDWLFIDEAHLFKNLWRFSKMERIAGLPNSNSERAFDMFVKTRYIMQKRGDGTGVVFATGTPVANSMAEMWVMQRYLQPGTLQRHGVDMFDTWAATFGEAVTALELAPDGSGYRMQTRFARFTNLPELLNMFREVADVRTAEMLDLPVPQVRYQTVTVQSTEALKQYVATLVERAEAIRGGRVSPREDNMLAVTNDGRKAALDMRLVDPDAADDPNGKVALCARNVADEWVRALDTKGTQIVFCDLSTPKADGSFSVYHDLRKKLVELGIPAADFQSRAGRPCSCSHREHEQNGCWHERANTACGATPLGRAVATR